MEAMQKNKALQKTLSPELSWQNRPFPQSAKKGSSADSVDAVTLGALLRACQLEAIETIHEFFPLRAVIDAKAPPEVTPIPRARNPYGNIEMVVWAIKELNFKVIPKQKDLLETHNALANALWHKHGLHRVALPFYPTPERLIPFVLLQAIYTAGNTGPLLGMRLRQISHKEVMGVRRIVYRVGPE
jgi:hypothetical protein